MIEGNDEHASGGPNGAVVGEVDHPGIELLEGINPVAAIPTAEICAPAAATRRNCTHETRCARNSGRSMATPRASLCRYCDAAVPPEVNRSRRTYFWTLPDGVRGKASTKTQWRGVLWEASWVRQ